MIFRKLATAINVLKHFGLKEAYGLVKDNLRKMLLFIKRKVGHLFHKISGKAISLFNIKSEGMHILYVTSDFEAYYSQTVRYRVHNVREALKGKAKTRFEVIQDGIYKDRGLIKWADVIILMRTTWTDKLDNLIKIAKELEIPVIFDIDDIIFLPSMSPDYCKVLGDTSEENIKLRAEEFSGFEKSFRACDYSTASTPFILEKMKAEGKKAYLIHNGLNKKQLEIAAKSHRKNDGVRAIGYLSGTKTHDKDFKNALDALIRILKEYPDTVFRVAGYLDTTIVLDELKSRVKPACYMSWQRLMAYGAQNYINIAPLDITNPFCHAKSELKYFEAAAVGVPTVASATDTYLHCIRNEQNGMLASNEDEWYNAIKKLLDDKDFYIEISKNAHENALSHYSPKNTAEEALAAYTAVIEDYKNELNKAESTGC